LNDRIKESKKRKLEEIKEEVKVTSKK